MASVVYPKAKEALESAAINLTSDDIRVVLVDTGAYTYSAAHDFLDDVPGGARIAVSGSLASKTVTDGVFDAADVTLTAVTGTSVEALVVYDHTGGSDAARRLLAYIDSGTGLPITPNGGDISIVWDSGASKIFAL